MDIRAAAESQRRLFAILDEFFTRTTGESSQSFATNGDFATNLRSKGRGFGKRPAAAYEWLDSQLREYYNGISLGPFSAAKTIGGTRLVSGGRFGSSHVASIRKSLLYADTILIPDPILPWVEVERREEKFRLTLILETAYNLLQLKPLIDVDLSVLPILVFPSWEKRLEERDQVTQDAIGDLFSRLISHYTNINLNTPAEVYGFATAHPGEFLTAVEKQQLFIPPNGRPGVPIEEAVQLLRTEKRTWNGGAYMETFERLTAAQQVAVAIFERMAPLFHHLENSFELDAHPLACLDSQAHYIRLYAKGTSDSLEDRGSLGAVGSAAISGLMQQQLEWLEDIPMPDLVRLRNFGDNEAFRKKTDEFLRQLSEANLQDMDRVVAEVTRGISSLISDHQKKIDEIRDKYALEHRKTLALGAVSVLSLCPILSPFVATITPSVMTLKYANDKLGEQSELRRASKSLMGVIANVRSRT